MPGKGERACIEDNEKIGDEFGKTWKGAEGERDSWRGICFYKAEGRAQRKVTACDGDRERHQDMSTSACLSQLMTRKRWRFRQLWAHCAASHMHKRLSYTTVLYRTTQNQDKEYANHQSPEGNLTSRPHQLPIGSQPPESRWSKRAGLHVLHCGPPFSSLRQPAP